MKPKILEDISQSTTPDQYILRNRKPNYDWRNWPELPPSEESDVPPPSQISSHPELEDEKLIAWGLANCSVTQNCGVVDYCEAKGDAIEWKLKLSDEELDMLADKSTTENQSHERSFRVFFLNTLESNRSWLPGNFDIRPRILQALLKAGLSRILLSEIFTSEGSFAKMGAQCFQKKDEKGRQISFEVCYRNQYGWDTGVGYIQSIRKGNQTTYFCINYAKRARDRFKAFIKCNPSIAYRDFYLDILAVEDACKNWRFTIGERRRRLLDYESWSKGNKLDGDNLDNLTRKLHSLARDWNTLNQDCSDFIDTLKFLERSYEKFGTSAKDNGWIVDQSTDMHETLGVLKAESENCARWTAVYKERSNIQINLVSILDRSLIVYKHNHGEQFFHQANQLEARNSKDIAEATAKVAEQTQRDSASMITMAAVTMLFLPGTFISTILSTTFFSFSEDKLSVSKEWWVLPASTIPTTIAVLVAWKIWRSWQLRRRAKDIKKHDAQDVEK